MKKLLVTLGVAVAMTTGSVNTAKADDIFQDNVPQFFTQTLPNWFAVDMVYGTLNFFMNTLPDFFNGPVKDGIETYQNGIDTATDAIGDWFSGPVKNFFEGPVKDVAEDAGNWFKNLWLGPESADERYLEEQKEKERQRIEQLRIETELARAEWEKQKDEEASWEYRPGQTILLDPGLR